MKKAYYIDVFKKYRLLLNEYCNKFDVLSNNVKKYTSSKKYAKGGLNCHMGYYCPSPIFDLVIGRCNRGKLVKTEPIGEEFYWEYLFDSDERILAINLYWNGKLVSVEFIIYKENYRLSVEYSCNTLSIEAFSECYYNNNKLIKYEFIYSIDYIGTYKCETYEYTDDGIYKCFMEECDVAFYLKDYMKDLDESLWNELRKTYKEISRFNSDLKPLGKDAPCNVYPVTDIFLRQHEFVFRHDENGFIRSYNAINYKHGKPEAYPNEDNVFYVPKSIKRRV